MKRHASETTLAHLQTHHSKAGPVLRLHDRRSLCRTCGRIHHRVKYQGYLDPSGKGEGNWIGTVDDDGPDVGEVIAGVLVMLLVFAAIFWALPVIAAYIVR